MSDAPAYTALLAPEVAAEIAAEVAQYDHGACETAWIGDWDGERVTAARLVFRGNNASAPFWDGDIRAGQVHIHSHPIRWDHPYPSEQDGAVAVALAKIGCGMLIVSSDCRRGYLVRPPILPRNDHKVWRLGRLSLVYLKRSKKR